MLSLVDSILILIYLIVSFVVIMTILYLLLKGFIFLLNKLMMLLLNKTTLDIRICTVIVLISGITVLGIIILLVWTGINSILW